MRELDVVRLVGDELVSRGEGAFQGENGRAPGKTGKKRAREPDHRMWAVRTLGLAEGRDGTGGEGDYQVRGRGEGLIVVARGIRRRWRKVWW